MAACVRFARELAPGAYPLQSVDVYLQDVVDDCRRAVDVLAAERRITITSSGPGDVPVRGDESCCGGIAETDRTRIFDRFVQLDASRRLEGTGLGLPIAKWIAEVHHGSLSLESTGPGGSTFRVDLPLATSV